MFEFQLPDIGEGISEAMLVEWLVKPGDTVKEGDDVATVSTDKVDVELPAPRTGVIAELCWQPGETIPVGDVVLRIETGASAAPKKPAAKAKPAAAAVTPAPAAAAAATAATTAIVAAPSTRKLAADLGLNLDQVAGSGPEGRILRRDIEARAGAGARPEIEREPLNAVRAVAFERLAQSVHTLAHSTMSFEAPADGLVQLLEKLKPEALRQGVNLTPVALFAKCVAAALTGHPRFNATIDEARRELVLRSRVNLSIAVATDAGLLVPVVAGVDCLTLFETARAVTDVAARGREGRLRLADTKDGTFTLSNTGGLEQATILSTRSVAG